MVFSRRKTGFIGFLVAIKSIEGIFCEWVEPENSPLRYLLTYKLSQDHLELFFGAIRCCGGFNNNPTSRQFTAAYKRLLLRSSIQSGHDNCITRDSTSILHVLEDTCYINGQLMSITDAVIIRKYDLMGYNGIEKEHNYPEMSVSGSSISTVKKAAISYISGYVV